MTFKGKMVISGASQAGNPAFTSMVEPGAELWERSAPNLSGKEPMEAST